MPTGQLEIFGGQDPRLSYHSSSSFFSTFASDNPVYVLMMNGFKGVYARVGGFFFSHENARDIATSYYKQLLNVLDTNEPDRVVSVVRKYGVESGKIWRELRHGKPKNLID